MVKKISLDPLAFVRQKQTQRLLLAEHWPGVTHSLCALRAHFRSADLSFLCWNMEEMGESSALPLHPQSVLYAFGNLRKRELSKSSPFTPRPLAGRVNGFALVSSHLLYLLISINSWLKPGRGLWLWKRQGKRDSRFDLHSIFTSHQTSIGICHSLGKEYRQRGGPASPLQQWKTEPVILKWLSQDTQGTGFRTGPPCALYCYCQGKPLLCWMRGSIWSYIFED